MSQAPSSTNGKAKTMVPESHASAVTARWAMGADSIGSPPLTPSSGTGVRRNHTIHGVRRHAEPRLEKHFEQPEGNGITSPLTHNPPAYLSSANSEIYHEGASVDPSDDMSFRELPNGLKQALYVKSNVSRNHSLPSRHSSGLISGLGANIPQGRSILFNSLTAITGGADAGENDWEKDILPANVFNEHAGRALPVPSSQTDTQWSETVFDHHRLPSSPPSVHQHSSRSHTDHLTESPRFGGGSMAMDALDVGAFQYSPSSASGSSIRRNQSLNNHDSGRFAARRLDPPSSRMQHRHERGPDSGSMTSSFSAFSPERSGHNLPAIGGPIGPSSQARKPWNVPPQDAIGSPSRFAGSFSSQNTNGIHVQADSSSSLDFDSSMSKLSMNDPGLAHPSSASPSLGPGSGTLPMRPPHIPHESTSRSNITMERKLPHLVTNRDQLQQGMNAGSLSYGPASAAASVPPIGHRHFRQQSHDPFSNRHTFEHDASRRGPFTSGPQNHWSDKERIAGQYNGANVSSQSHQAASAQIYDAGDYRYGNGVVPDVRALSMALAHAQHKNAMLEAQLDAQSHQGAHDGRLFGMTSIHQQGLAPSIGQQLRGPGSKPTMMGSLPPRVQEFRPRTQYYSQPGARSDTNGHEGIVHASSLSPNPPTLALQKGYNPPPGTFDLAPISARFFVIKSYTEDDVHKSLKHEIWASTDKGNQRLDKAFRDSASSGPIYLFYSVNASGHFCGMAQMLTPLDYTTSSNVWAQDGKWKGTFKVRWIYVKDLPNSQLRHIRLTNTQECKPVTQSRDTQELTPEAGREVLQILSAYTAKTSLLQDLQFYELQGSTATSPPSTATLSTTAGSPELGVRSTSAAETSSGVGSTSSVATQGS